MCEILTIYKGKIIIYEKNTIARIIQVIGILTIIIGLIEDYLGGKIVTSAYSSKFSFEIALPIWIARFVSRIICIGFSEIVALLHNIYLKLQNIDYQFKISSLIYVKVYFSLVVIT